MQHAVNQTILNSLPRVIHLALARCQPDPKETFRPGHEGSHDENGQGVQDGRRRINNGFGADGKPCLANWMALFRRAKGASGSPRRTMPRNRRGPIKRASLLRQLYTQAHQLRKLGQSPRRSFDRRPRRAGRNTESHAKDISVGQ